MQDKLVSLDPLAFFRAFLEQSAARGHHELLHIYVHEPVNVFLRMHVNEAANAVPDAA